ncbi:uncharacterized protein LOC143039533 [Oratosquilla oratoria]|uniref:uncharacterized protein LOC143039533 n=1 Tax=Oratosquilla oratoria TaxID=337810 RepID=UPI003F7679F5
MPSSCTLAAGGLRRTSDTFGNCGIFGSSTTLSSGNTFAMTSCSPSWTGRSNGGGTRGDALTYNNLALMTYREPTHTTNTTTTSSSSSSRPQHTLSSSSSSAAAAAAAAEARAARIPSLHPRAQVNYNLFRMGHVGWGTWLCFVFVTLLLVPAHLYLKQINYHGELLGVFFVSFLLFILCFSFSLFHTKTRSILLHRLNLDRDMGAFQSSRASTHSEETDLNNHHNHNHHHHSHPPFYSRSAFTPVHFSDIYVHQLDRPLPGGGSESSRGGGGGGGGGGGRTRAHSNPSSTGIYLGHDLTTSCDLESVIASEQDPDPPPYHEAVRLPDEPPMPPPSASSTTTSPTSHRPETPPPSYDHIAKTRSS